jgi:Fe-S-cluster-containing hydrogenase component 2
MPAKGWIEVNELFCKGCELCVSACPPKVLELENEKLTPDERVLRLIMHLAPDLPIVYKGFSLSSTTDLEAIAQQGLQGNEECQNFIFNLHKQRILESFSGPQYSYLQKIQRNWVAAEKDYNQSWKLVLDQKGSTKFKPNFIKVALPSLLLMSISTKIQEEMRQEIKSKTTDYAMGCEWFTVLGSPEKASCSLICIMQLLVSEADRVVRDSHNHLVREISTLKKEFSNLIESCDSQTASDILDLEQSSSQISYRAILEKTDKIPYIKTKGRKELEFNDMIKWFMTKKYKNFNRI